jgi:UDP-N-acetylmuramate dehydrogenase
VTVAEIAGALEAALAGRVERDAPSASRTTYRCGGTFAVLVHVGTEDELRRVARIVGGTDVQVLVVGRGSNLLVADEGFDGVALVLDGDFATLSVQPESARVVAGGAVALPVLARQATAAGIRGLEFFVGIPGSVGGAVRMNAGGHGRDTSEVLAGARLGSLGDGTFHDVDPPALELGFRRSAVGPRTVVVSATFAGEPGDAAGGAATIDEIVRWRREHQPGGQNAGSVFENPPGDAAGRLIDAAGCKGRRIGGAFVSEKHANFFVADPGACAADVFALLREVRAVVAERTGVQLEPELRLVGFSTEVNA